MCVATDDPSLIAVSMARFTLRPSGELAFLNVSLPGLCAVTVCVAPYLPLLELFHVLQVKQCREPPPRVPDGIRGLRKTMK